MYMYIHTVHVQTYMYTVYVYLFTHIHNICRQISKKHQIRLDTPWLDPNKTLAEQVFECTVFTHNDTVHAI